MKFFKNIYTTVCVALTLSLSLLFVAQVQATHVVGGNIMYRCLDNNQWEITLEFANDCGLGDINALSDDSIAVIKFFDPTTNELIAEIAEDGIRQITFSEVIELGDETVACRVFEDPVCVRRQVYRTVVDLPFREGGYLISYRRCCRNSSLINVIDPLETGTTEWILLTDLAQTECNSSPVYRDWPTVYVCTNEDLEFNHSATDIDGDSLVYRLCIPTAGGDSNPLNSGSEDIYFPPFDQVAFAAGFDLTNLLGSGVPLTIDSQTGLITANPNITGQYIVGVCVDEFRNGELLSTVRRNFQYNVRNCTDPPIAAAIPELNPSCESLEVCFENESESTQGNPLTYQWFFEFPDLSIVDTNFATCYTFPEPGLYTVALVVEDGFCSDTSFVDVGVSVPGDPTALFNLVSAQFCDDGLIVTLQDSTITSQAIVDWTWTVDADGQTMTYNGSTPSFPIEGDQTITVTLLTTTISGCTDEITMDLDIVGIPGFGVDFPDFIDVCQGVDAEIVTDIPDGLDVTFDPDEFINFENGVISLTGSGTFDNISITLSDEICTVTQVIDVNQFFDPQLPEDLIDGMIVQCGSNTVILNPSGNPNFDYMWTSSDPDLVFDETSPNPVVFVTEETVFTVIVSNGPCSVQGNITVIPEEGVVGIDDLIDGTIIQCGSNSAVLNPAGNPTYDYMWTSSDPNLVFDNTSANPVVFVTQETEFTVLITNGPCTEEGNVTVIPLEGVVGLNFQDSSIGCNDTPTIFLNSNGNPTYDYIWSASDPDLNFNPNDPNPLVSLDVTTTFTAIVSNGPCTETFEFTVVVDLVFDDVNIQDQTFVCYDGSSIELNPTGNPNYDYSWTSNDPNLQFDMTAVNPNVVLTQPTVFGVLITEGQCQEQFSLFVNFEGIIPDLDVIPAMTGTCSGSPIALNPSGDPDLTYQWTSSDPNLVFDMNVANPVVTVTQATTFNVTVSDGPCTSTTSVQVLVDSGPVVTLNNQLIQCIGTEIVLNENGNTDFLYEWEADNPDIVFDENAPSPIVSVESNTSFTVTITDPNDSECSRETFVNVVVPPSIELSVDVELDSIFLCEGENITVNATSNVNDLVWTNEVGDTILIGNQITLIYDEPQLYTLTAMDMFGCTEVIELEIIQAPQGGIEIMSSTDDLTYCPNEEILLMAFVEGQTLTDILWFDENGNEIGQGPELSVTPTGDVTYNLTASNEFGCPATAMINLFEVPLDIIIEGPQVICLGDEATLSATVDGVNTDDLEFLWEPSETIIGDNTTSAVTIAPGADTDYVVTVTDANGCSGLAIYSVQVVGPGAVTATASAEEIPVGGTVVLGVTPIDSTWTFSWGPEEFLDDPFSPNPIATCDMNGVQTFTVTVTGANGCTTTSSVNVSCIGACDNENIFVPNMFTPNGDSQNDVFQVYSNQIDEMSLIVYDRWGEEIIELNSVGDAWDGTFEGEELNPDVYGYCIQARCFDGEEFTQRGNITLIK